MRANLSSMPSKDVVIVKSSRGHRVWGKKSPTTKRLRTTRRIGQGRVKKLRRVKITRSKIIKNLDKVFSLFIRQKYGTRCYTCNQIGKMQCGHYISRSVRSTRWEEDNCRPQCYGCNIMHGGRPIDFREHLIKDFGEDWVKFLENKRHTLFNPSDEWILLKTTEYQNKLDLVN